MTDFHSREKPPRGEISAERSCLQPQHNVHVTTTLNHTTGRAGVTQSPQLPRDMYQAGHSKSSEITSQEIREKASPQLGNRIDEKESESETTNGKTLGLLRELEVAFRETIRESSESPWGVLSKREMQQRLLLPHLWESS